MCTNLIWNYVTNIRMGLSYINLYSFMFWSLSFLVSLNHDHHVWLDYSPSINYILMGNLIYGFKWHPIQAWWISKAIKQESWKWLIQLFTLFFIHVGWVSIHISFHMVNNWFQFSSWSFPFYGYIDKNIITNVMFF